MRNLLLAVLSLAFVSGCITVELTHEHGELPELEVPEFETFCDAGHDLDVTDKRGGEIVFTCDFSISI